MLMPLLNAYDPHALASRARRDRTKEPRSEPFVVGSVLEKSENGQRNASDARPGANAPGDRAAAAFEEALAELESLDGGAEDAEEFLPEDALDGLGLCALLKATSSG